MLVIVPKPPKPYLADGKSRKQKMHMRMKARCRHLDRLYAEQNSLCHWCKSQTAIVGNIPRERRINVGATFVAWRDGEEVFSARVATVDHVKPISDGGDNDPRNLVMACADCNKDRTATRSQVPDEIRRVCPDCLCYKPKQRRRCKSCGIKASIAWLVECGWQQVPTHDGQSKFVDPETGEAHILRVAAHMQERRLVKQKTPAECAPAGACSLAAPATSQGA